MKTNNYLLLFSLVIVIITGNSCTIQKRRYTRGWYVDWHLQKQEKHQATVENQQDENPKIIKRTRVRVIESILAEEKIRMDYPLFASSSIHLNDLKLRRSDGLNEIEKLTFPDPFEFPISDSVSSVTINELNEGKDTKKKKGLNGYQIAGIALLGVGLLATILSGGIGAFLVLGALGIIFLLMGGKQKKVSITGTPEQLRKTKKTNAALATGLGAVAIIFLILLGVFVLALLAGLAFGV